MGGVMVVVRDGMWVCVAMVLIPPIYIYIWQKGALGQITRWLG